MTKIAELKEKGAVVGHEAALAIEAEGGVGSDPHEGREAGSGDDLRRGEVVGRVAVLLARACAGEQEMILQMKYQSGSVIPWTNIWQRMIGTDSAV